MTNISPRFKRYIDDATGRPYIHDSDTGEVKWELPEDRDWIELVDPASGRTYWYNQTTKSSQWENPAFRIVSPSTSLVKSEELQQQQQKPVWKSKIDKATGRKYWYNRLTRESSWYPPPTNVENEKPDVTSSTISLGLQGNSNWEKFLDPTSNRTFYFHIKKGISQWESPSELIQEAGSFVESSPPQKGLESRQSATNNHIDNEEGVSRVVGSRGKSINSSFVSDSVSTMETSFNLGREVDESQTSTRGRLLAKLNAAASADKIVLASELLEYVQLPVVANGEWRKQEFRLLSNGILQCGPSGFTIPHAQLDVNQIASIVEDLGKCQFTLEASFGKTLIKLKAESPAECAKWTRAISEFILNTTVSSEQESTTSQAVFHDSTKLSSQSTSRAAMTSTFSQVAFPPGGNEQESISGGNVPEPTRATQSTNGAISNDSRAMLQRASSEQADERFHESTKMVGQVMSAATPPIRIATFGTGNNERESILEESFYESMKTLGQATPRASPSRRPVTFQSIPDSPGLLQRLISQASELKIKLADAESAFDSAYAHVHEWKVKSLASRWARKKDRGAGLGAETDPKSMAHYAGLWASLRSHPSLIARIGSMLKSNEAKRMFASTLVTSLLDPCSIPPSLCLTQVVSAAIGTTFEGPLSEALATYSEYQTSMRFQLEWLFNGEECSVSHALARFSQSLELCCPRYFQLYGRRFVSELVRNVILEERNALVNPSVADEFLNTIETGSSTEFESRIDAVLKGKETSKTELFTGPFLPIKKWNKFVSTSFELFALHMAVSKHNFSLPEDVRSALQELGKPKPMFVSNGEHPYFALDLPSQHQKADATSDLEQAIERAKESGKKTDLEEDIQHEKEVVKCVLAAIENARMLLDSYRQSTEYVNRFTLIFAEKQAQFERGLVVAPRFGANHRRPSVSSAPSSPFSVTVNGVKKPSDRSVLSEAPFDAQVSPMEMQRRKARSVDQVLRTERPSSSSPPQVPIPISFSPASVIVSNDYVVDYSVEQQDFQEDTDEWEPNQHQQAQWDHSVEQQDFQGDTDKWEPEYFQQEPPVTFHDSPMFNFARATASSTQKEVFLPGASPKNPWLSAGGTVSHHRKGI